jgi:hypothetical protein
MGLTIKDLEKLQKLGKIRGFQVRELKPVKVEVGGRIVTKHWGKVSKEKDWLGSNLLFWCNEKALTLQEEYKFHVERNFRLDYFIPALKLGIEYEGIMSEKSRHTTVTGYSKDTDKYRLAAMEGINVLRYTPLNYKNVIDDLNEIYETHLRGRD